MKAILSWSPLGYFKQPPAVLELGSAINETFASSDSTKGTAEISKLFQMITNIRNAGKLTPFDFGEKINELKIEKQRELKQLELDTISSSQFRRFESARVNSEILFLNKVSEFVKNRLELLAAVHTLRLENKTTYDENLQALDQNTAKIVDAIVLLTLNSEDEEEAFEPRITTPNVEQSDFEGFFLLDEEINSDNSQPSVIIHTDSKKINVAIEDYKQETDEEAFYFEDLLPISYIPLRYQSLSDSL